MDGKMHFLVVTLKRKFTYNHLLVILILNKFVDLLDPLWYKESSSCLVFPNLISSGAFGFSSSPYKSRLFIQKSNRGICHAYACVLMT